MKFPLLISAPTHITYLTGLPTNGFERDFWLLLTKKSTYFFTDARYGNLLTEFKANRRKSRLGSLIKPVEISTANPLSTSLVRILTKIKAPHLYFEAENLTVAEANMLRGKLRKHAPSTRINLQLKPTTNLISNLRALKQQDEVKAIQRACRAIDACLRDIVHLIRPGITEYEVALKLEMWLREKGHACAFPPIVAINENTAIPHYNTYTQGKKRITENCILLIDAGAKVENYCSDITRMFVIGTPSNEFIHCYNAVLSAQKKTIAYMARLATGVEIARLDLFCRTELEKAGLQPHLHATGHGIGLDVHEAPRISFNSKDAIKPGHVITIEPGTYLEGKFGVRIEDTIYINEQRKPIIFTTFPKALRMESRS